MSTQNTEPFIKYTPHLWKDLGRGETMFLNKLFFHLKNPSLGKQHGGKKWIYKTRTQWGKELKYSPRQIQNIISLLLEKGVIAVKKLNPHKSNRTNYYTIHEEKLNLLLHENPHLLEADFTEEEKTKEPILDDKDPESQVNPHEEMIAPSSGNNFTFCNTKNTNKDSIN